MKMILLGIRPKTLVAGILPPIVAQALAYAKYGNTNFQITIFCILLAVFIQIATNFYNDAVDFKKGADEDRVGPKRITNEKNVKTVFRLGHLFIIMALIVGIPLVLKGGVVFFGLGIISLFFAYGYTGGPFPLAYLGLGELFVFLFFGILATCGSYFLIQGFVDVDIFLLGTLMGLLSSVLIAINNLRDRDKDALVSKNTLATKISKQNYIKLIEFFIFAPYVILFYFVCFVDLHFVPPLLAIGIAHKIRFQLHHYLESEELNVSLGLAGKHLAVFGILFSLSVLWG